MHKTANHYISFILSVLLISATILRNSIWQTDHALWSDTLKKSPLKPRVIDAVGKSYDDMGNTAYAAEYYKKAVDLDPKQVKARHHLFYAYIRLNMPEHALEVITAPEAGFLEHPEAYSVLAGLFVRLGRYNEAIQAFKRIIELDPNNLNGYMDYAVFLIEINRPLEAIDILKKALTKWPDRPELINNLGIAYEASGRFMEAEEAYMQAAKMAPEADEPKENLLRIMNRARK